MKTLRFAGPMVVVLLLGAAAAPAQAQDVRAIPVPDEPAPPAIEVFPFVALDSRASTPIGVAASFPLNSSLSIETEVDYRRAEGHLNALSSSANLLYFLPRIGRTTPYLASGIGLAQYGAPLVSRDGSLIGTHYGVAVEVNAGGGLKTAVNKKWDMRTDARWFKSLGRQSSEHWRLSHGVSFDVAKR
jgi:hypothetical protein